MKIFTKSILAVVAMVTMVSAAFAGGPMTNTNQSAHFLRSVARGTSLETDAVYTNPAGVVSQTLRDMGYDFTYGMTTFCGKIVKLKPNTTHRRTYTWA